MKSQHDDLARCCYLTQLMPHLADAEQIIVEQMLASSENEPTFYDQALRNSRSDESDAAVNHCTSYFVIPGLTKKMRPMAAAMFETLRAETGGANTRMFRVHADAPAVL